VTLLGDCQHESPRSRSHRPLLHKKLQYQQSVKRVQLFRTFTRGSAHAETARLASHWRQNFTFFNTPLIFLRRIRHHGITIPVGFRTQVAKAKTYPVKCRFQLIIALCDHNAPTLRPTDVMLVYRSRDMLMRHVALKRSRKFVISATLSTVN